MLNNRAIILLNGALTDLRYGDAMDLSNSLEAVLLRRTAEAAERAASVRADRRRETAEQTAVEFGEAQSQKAEDRRASPVDPLAAFDKMRNDDVGYLIDIVT